MNISQPERTFGNRSEMCYRDITKYHCGIGNLNCLLYYPLNLQLKNYLHYFGEEAYFFMMWHLAEKNNYMCVEQVKLSASLTKVMYWWWVTLRAGGQNEWCSADFSEMLERLTVCTDQRLMSLGCFWSGPLSYPFCPVKEIYKR